MAARLRSLLAGKPPASLGLHGDALGPCPSTPNCVSSRAGDARHAVTPLAFDGPGDDAWRRLVAAVGATPGARIVGSNGGYLHAECSSATLGFVDDLEAQLDEKAGLIHLRSASRLGRYDFGANRARIEALRRDFAAAAMA